VATYLTRHISRTLLLLLLLMMMMTASLNYFTSTAASLELQLDSNDDASTD